MFYYGIDNKHGWKYFILWAKTICWGLDRAQREAQTDGAGHHQTADAELAQVVWCLAQPFQELALAPQTMSPISSHSKSFETNVSDQRSRIWSLTQIFKVFKPFKTPVGV